IYDAKGNGRLRFNGSFSRYVSQPNEGIESNVTTAGTPAIKVYQYDGADITGTPHQALQQLFAWFNGLGGVAGITDPNILVQNTVPGASQQLKNGKLSSPYVDEFTIGAGMQLGVNGYLRADVIDRKWKGFYANQTDLGTGTV